MLKAAEVGNLDFIKVMVEAKPELLNVANATTKSGILSYAIKHRQGKIVDFAFEQNPGKWLKASFTDEMGNNMLHQAVMLGSWSQRDSNSGWVLKLQKDFQWFEVIVHH